MTTWKEKMAVDARHIRIPEVDNPTRAEQECLECQRLVREEYECLEMNVGAADRNSTSYVMAARDGRSRCSKHGRDRRE